MSAEPGLRERKKQQTRRLISDVASGLFMRRGFDNVTVAEIAKAADVSTKTVFNYFPRKEDLFLDRLPEALDMVANAIRRRPEGAEPSEALRELLLRLLAERHPLSGVGENFHCFWQVVLDSPALQARVREFVQELEAWVTLLFAEAEGVDPDEPRVRFAAALSVAACRTVYASGVRRLFAGAGAEQVAADMTVLANRCFDAVGRAMETF